MLGKLRLYQGYQLNKIWLKLAPNNFPNVYGHQIRNNKTISNSFNYRSFCALDDLNPIRTIKTKYRAGGITIAIPIRKENGVVEPQIFALPLKMNVGDFRSTLSNENYPSSSGSDIANDHAVTVTNKETVAFGDDVTLEDVILKGSFILNIGDEKFKVKPPNNFIDGAYGVSDLDGILELRTVIQKASFNQVRKTLEADVRSIMPYKEYLKICSFNGVPKTEADSLLRNLHSCGILLHFHQSKIQSLHDFIFLKPDEVTDAMFTKLGLETPTQNWLKSQSAKKQVELEQIQDKLQPLEQLRQELDIAATSHANRMIWAGFGGVTSIIGFKWYLTYIYFSWDIMEPVTFFSASGMSIIALAWWITRRTDLSEGSFYNYFYASKKAKLFRLRKFDEKKFYELSSSLKQCKKEIEELEVSDYNPALIACYLRRKD
jgi:hypothetical protein